MQQTGIRLRGLQYAEVILTSILEKSLYIIRVGGF